MRRWGVAVVFVTLVLAAPAQSSVPVQTFTVVNETRYVRAPFIRSLEHALVLQSQQLRHYWHTPLVAFGPNGWPMLLQPGLPPPVCDCAGFHGSLPDGTPYGRIWACCSWDITMSHEMIEMLVGKEAADPVQSHAYVIDARSSRVRVSDFVTPAYYSGGAGPLDEMDSLRRR